MTFITPLRAGLTGKVIVQRSTPSLARLGHPSIQITADRYGHLFPRSDAVIRSMRRAELATTQR